MASNVDIAKDARFKFQIIYPVFNHVADADNASQLAVAKHRHVAHAMAGHQAHQAGEIIPEGRGDQAVRHDVLYLHRGDWFAVLRERAHNISRSEIIPTTARCSSPLERQRSLRVTSLPL